MERLTHRDPPEARTIELGRHPGTGTVAGPRPRASAAKSRRKPMT